MSAYVNTPLHEVEFGCGRCLRRFGPYMLEPQDDDAILPIDPAGRPSRLVGYYWEPRHGSTRRRKGPRTGTGLYLETFDGRPYVRVKCKCGRNEKLGREQLDRSLFDADGVLRLRVGVVYL